MPKKKPKKRIKNNNEPKTMIANNNPYDRTGNIKLLIDPEFTFFSSCIVNDKSFKFTNYYKNEQEAMKIQLDIFMYLPNFLKNKTFANLSGEQHVHSVDSQKILNNISKVIKEYTNEDVDDTIYNQIYQMKLKGKCRIFGSIIPNTSIFQILFVDPYHMVYPNENFSKKEVLNNKYCISEKLK